MFEKKQKVLIFGGAVIAVLFLIFGLIFLKLDIKESEIDPVQVNTELITYEEYVHRCGFSGRFETDVECFGEQLSSLYPNINIRAYDENTISFLNDLTIVIIDDKTVEIIATQTNQKKTVQITENDEGTFIHTLDFECEHRYKVVQDDRNNCVDNGVQYCQCELCGQSFTAILFATGHAFEGEGCLAVCTVCKTSKEEPEHVFQEQRMTGEYVAKYGTCSVKTQYFYSCLYCDKMGEKIFDGNYEDKHRPASKPTVSKINNSTAYYTLSCLDCAAELLHARITSITDPTTNNISLSIETEANVEYSLDNKNFSKNYPIFDTTGTYILYYQITDGRYTMKDSISIQWTNIERIDIDFVPDTAKDNPYIIYDNIIYALVLVLSTMIVKVDTTSIVGSILVIVFYLFVTILFIFIKKKLKCK